MVKYLMLLKSQLPTNIDAKTYRFLIEELNRWSGLYQQTSGNNQRNSLYSHPTDEINTYVCHLPSGEKVSIGYDVGQIQQKVMQKDIQHLSLTQFKDILKAYLAASTAEFVDIGNEVFSTVRCSEEPLIIMSFKPQNNYILLDGKYRFAEYAKFKQQDLLPCFFVDSEDCCKNIVLEKDLIAYKILKKLQTIEAFLKGEACLSELENIC